MAGARWQWTTWSSRLQDTGTRHRETDGRSWEETKENSWECIGYLETAYFLV